MWRTVFLFLLAALCLRLSLWQWHRYHEKKALFQHYAQLESLPPETSLAKHPSAFQHYQLKGTLLPRYFLLQNQFFKHQRGVDVLQPFVLNKTQPWLIVNRGWLPLNQLHTLENTPKHCKISGEVIFPSPKQFRLKKAPRTTENKPQPINLVAIPELKVDLKHPLYPFLLRLLPQSPIAFQTHWTLATLPPEKHLSYAIQWFAFALILLIGFAILSLQKRHS